MSTDYEAEARQLMANGPGHGPDNCDYCGVFHLPASLYLHDLAQRLEHAGDIIAVELRVREIVDAVDPYVAHEVVSSLYNSGQYDEPDD